MNFGVRVDEVRKKSRSQCGTRFLATNLQNKIHRLAVTAKKFHSKSSFLLAKLISFT